MIDFERLAKEETVSDIIAFWSEMKVVLVTHRWIVFQPP